MKRLERLAARLLFGGDRQGQAVDVHVAPVDAQSLGALDDALCYLKTAVGSLWNAVFVQGQSDDSRAVLLYERKHLGKALFLAVDGVDDGLAAVAAQSRVEHPGLG